VAASLCHSVTCSLQRQMIVYFESEYPKEILLTMSQHFDSKRKKKSRAKTICTDSVQLHKTNSVKILTYIKICLSNRGGPSAETSLRRQWNQSRRK
jgi:hypothetical protein